MSAFVISLKDNGKYKYTFEHRRGKTLMTSVEYSSVEAIHSNIEFLRTNFSSLNFIKFKTPSGKHYFRLAIDKKIFANSRRFNTELRFEKAMEEIKSNFANAEILDLSFDIFGDLSAEDIFGSD
ncbi:hypothetical protein HX017_14795 [Myroides marinus]|uniref:DUF1508 domain-containing protein n=1 Tax=Myroides marinus TaxID=703342 RepID=A0A161S250_9FLAO|nr:hypothetical protein [Myroides marinus]KZE78354.1 hypothetical protein AV926_12970 [Myroides marinus]MDM1348376.1 hypothetical protein [Myroides marinus]MDM1351869.1 hypothetical protein [Myroides marinus]MDM1355569.1 hypothetical protein [Myroides marinus]MDM1359095.1 hypothetical protein [Myroides marinus]